MAFAVCFVFFCFLLFSFRNICFLFTVRRSRLSDLGGRRTIFLPAIQYAPGWPRLTKMAELSSPPRLQTRSLAIVY